MKNRSDRDRPAKPDKRERSASAPPQRRRGKPSGGRAGRAETPQSSPAQAARLHKIMAAAGLGSRRGLEKQIRDGEVRINGSVASLGMTAKPGDRLSLGDKEWLVAGENVQHRTLIYNKPEGEVTSRSDPEGRPTVFDKMPYLEDSRWVAVGRLDINTTGLLLLTTDGELAHAMMHPSNQVDREYVCRVRGLVSEEQLEQLKTGVMLDDGPAHFNDATRMGGRGANQWYQVTLLEGRNREVRRLWEAVDHMVSRLKRVRYGAALLPRGLKVGHWSEISPKEHLVLREDVSLPVSGEELTLQAIGVEQKPGHNQAGWGKNSARRKAAAKPGARRRSPQQKPRDAAAKPRASHKPANKRKNSKPGSPSGTGRRPPAGSRRSER